jgi:hypothetical protein
MITPLNPTDTLPVVLRTLSCTSFIFRLQQCNETHNIRYYFIYAPSILLSYTWIAKKNLLVVTFEGVVILSHKLCVPLNILYFKLALSTQKRSKPLKYQLKINNHSKNFENRPQNSFFVQFIFHTRELLIEIVLLRSKLFLQLNLLLLKVSLNLNLPLLSRKPFAN